MEKWLEIAIKSGQITRKFKFRCLILRVHCLEVRKQRLEIRYSLFFALVETSKGLICVKKSQKSALKRLG